MHIISQVPLYAARRCVRKLYVVTGILLAAQADAGLVFTNFDGPPPNDDGLSISGVNNHGVVIGAVFDADFNKRGFVGVPPGPFDEFALPVGDGHVFLQTQLGGINDADVAVAYTPTNPGVPGNPLLLFAQGSFTTLPALPDDFGGTSARGINNAGTIAGSFNDLVQFKPRGYVRDADGTYTRFDATPTTEFTSVSGINNNGVIVGSYSILHAFTAGFLRAADGTIKLLDTPAQIGGIAVSNISYGAINDQGVSVGSFVDAANNFYGFIRDASGTFALVQAPANPLESALVGINDAGLLVGIWIDPQTGAAHGFLARPEGNGDLNCDGTVNFADINPFVLALSNPTGYAQQYPDCNVLNGDINGDGRVDFGDINPFVGLLSGR